MPTVRYDFTADTSGLENALAKADKGLDSLGKEAKQASKQVDKALGGNKNSADKLAKSFDSLEKVAQGLGGGPIAGLLGQAKNLTEGLGTMGVGAAVAVGSFAALAVGAAALAGGVIAVNQAAVKFMEDLKGYEDIEGFQPLPAEVAASIESADAAFRSLMVVGKEMAVILAGNLAGGTEELALILVKLSLVAMDAFTAFSEGENILVRLAKFVTEKFIQALLSPVTALVSLISLWGEFASAVGADFIGDKLSGLSDKWKGFTATVAETAIDFYVDKGTEALGDLVGATGDYDARAKALIETTKKLTAAKKADVKATKAQVIALEDLTKWYEDQFGPVSTKTTDIIRELSDEVDALIPPEALSRHDELVLLQARLAAEMSRSQEVAESLEPAYAAVTAELSGMGEASKGINLDQVMSGISAAEGGLASIATLIGGPVAGAVLGLIQDLRGTIEGLTAELIALPLQLAEAPELLKDFYVSFAENLLPGLINAIPAIIDGLVQAVADPAFWAAILKLNYELLKFMAVGWIEISIEFAKSLFKLLSQAWKSFASGEMFDTIHDMVSEWWVGLKDGSKEWVDGIIEWFKGIDLLDLLDGLKEFFLDFIMELRTLGTAETATFGDTPGIVQVGPRGLTASFAPGDKVVAAKTSEDLARMAGSTAGTATPSLPPAAPSMSYRDSHRMFEPFVRDHLRLSTSLRDNTFAAPTTGRGNPYRS